MTKQVKQLDRVIIRFAGDSGDGMQLTGDRFTQETASFGNDLSTLPNFPAEIRAPAGHAARRLVLPAALRRPRHPHPGRRPRRARRDEPGRAQGQHRGPARRARRSSSTPTTSPPQPGQGRLRPRPARGRLARRVRGARRRPDRHDRRGGQGVRAVPQGRRAAPRTCSRSACCRGCTAGPPRRRSRSCERRFAKVARHPRRQRHRVQGRLELRRDHRDVRGAVRGQAGPDADRHLPQHHRQPGPRLRPGRRRRSSPGCRCSSAPTRSPRPPTSCTSCRKHKRFGVTTFQAEDEIAGIGAALGAAFAGALGVTTTSGPGVALKSETIGLGVMLELPLLVVRHPARRPVDRPAHQDRAGRPAAGDVRPQRRGAGADRGAAVPGRLLRRRPRGGPDRGHLPHPGDAALRRLPRQRLRALADPGRRAPAARSTRRSPPSPTTTGRGRREHGVLAVPARRGDAGPAVGGPRHPGPRAPHRRPGEGRRHGNISYDPANHDFMVRTRAAKVERIAETIPPHGGRRPRPTGRAPACWCSAGARRTARSAPPSARCATRA